ncbi:PIN domain-containing protein [Sulfolobus tengchongensis]|uniref:PIN domain-containing protein n=1 Tax=Sulfolobus tengchongensis TaxID=207809 RepID=A0AAX4KY39_9CREN
MKYFDTSVIILSILNDYRREKALRELRSGGITSDLGLIELVSYLSRNLNGSPLPYAIKILSQFNISVRSLFSYANTPLGNILEVFYNGIKLAETVKLKTLDLLHVSYAILLGVNELITADKEFIKAENLLNERGIILKIIE